MIDCDAFSTVALSCAFIVKTISDPAIRTIVALSCAFIVLLPSDLAISTVVAVSCVYIDKMMSDFAAFFTVAALSSVPHGAEFQADPTISIFAALAASADLSRR